MILFLHNVKPEYAHRIETQTGDTVLQLGDFQPDEAGKVLAEAEIMIGFTAGLTQERLLPARVYAGFTCSPPELSSWRLKT